MSEENKDTKETAPAGLTVKFNKKDVTLTPEEAIPYIQKAMNYDHKMEKLNADREELKRVQAENDVILSRGRDVLGWLDKNPRGAQVMDAIARGDIEAARQSLGGSAEEQGLEGEAIRANPGPIGPNQADLETQRKLDKLIARQEKFEENYSENQRDKALKDAFTSDPFLGKLKSRTKEIAEDLLQGYIKSGHSLDEATTLASHGVKDLVGDNLEAKLENRRENARFAEVSPEEGGIELPAFDLPKADPKEGKKERRLKRRSAFMQHARDTVANIQRGPS